MDDPLQDAGGFLDPEAFARALEDSPGAVLLLIRIDRLPEIRAERGEETAEKLLTSLALALRLRWPHVLGRTSKDALGVIIPASAGLSPAEARRTLGEALRAGFRFAMSLGTAAGPGTLDELSARAEASMSEEEGEKGAAPKPASTLAERYQRLSLLNRFAVELFSEEDLVSSLRVAGHSLLALSGARYLAILREAAGGGSEVLHRHGDKEFCGAEAAAAESHLLAQLREGRAARWLVDRGLGLHGTPIPAGKDDPASGGALVTGYPGAAPPPPETVRLMAEIAHLLQKAFAIDRHYRRQRTLAAVTEQSADPIILMDLEGRVSAWGRGARETFGYDTREALGRRIEEFLIPPDQKAHCDRVWAEAAEKGLVKEFECLLWRKDGQALPVEATLTRIEDDAGRPCEMVVVVRDISRRKEMERLRTDFVNMVSHDLRTPLTSIRGFAETMAENWSELDEGQKKHFLGIIQRESQRLGRLVAEFLDAARLEAGAAHVRRAPVDLCALAAKVAETFQGHPGGVRIETAFEEGLPHPPADADQIQRVLVNLLGNALKYSPENGLVRICGRRIEGAVEVSVQDEGPGLPEEAMRRLFQKFYRAGDELTRRLPGTGLGLYGAKTLVEAHGGGIRAENAPGRGARFSFTLPLQAEIS